AIRAHRLRGSVRIPTLMTSPLRRWWIETEDWLRYHPIVRDLFGRYLFALENPKVSRNAQDSVRSIKTLCAAARLLHSPAKVGQVEQHILQRVATLDPSKVDWTEFVPNNEKKWNPPATILKPYGGPREP